MLEAVLPFSVLALGLVVAYLLWLLHVQRQRLSEPEQEGEPLLEPASTRSIPPPIPSGVHDDVPLKLVGLVGPSFAGKSLIAKQLVPTASADHEWSDDDVAVSWSEVGATRPIESLYRVKMSTKGEDGQQRRLYQIHDILVELFGGSPAYGAPLYSELVDLTYWVESLQADEGVLGYARFAHSLGDALREVDEHVFVKHLRTKIIREHANMLAQAKASDDSGLTLPSAHVVVVPDLHTTSEVEWLNSHTYAAVFGVNVVEAVDELAKLAENSYDAKVNRKFWLESAIEQEAMSIDPNTLYTNLSLRDGSEVKRGAQLIVDSIVGRKTNA